MWIYFIGNYCSLAIEKLEKQQVKAAKKAASEAAAALALASEAASDVPSMSEDSGNSRNLNLGQSLLKGLSSKFARHPSDNNDNSQPDPNENSRSRSSRSFRN